MKTKVSLILCLLLLIGIYAVIMRSVIQDPAEMYQPPYQIFRRE